MPRTMPENPESLARREADAFINVTVVLVKPFSKYHSKFDFSAFSKIQDLKRECEKVLQVPSDRQLWQMHNGAMDLNEQKTLSDYSISDRDVIHIRVRE